MKQKTLGLIFEMITMGMAFAISAYVLYYIFVGDIANFNMLALWSGGGFMIMLLPLHMFLNDYCENDEEVEK